MSENEQLDMTRSPLPNTRSLQASIIAQAEGLPQHLEFVPNSEAVENRRRWNFRIALPLATFCIVALVMVTRSGQLQTSQTQFDSALVTVGDDLDWQEIMLLEDEWLLADL